MNEPVDPRLVALGLVPPPATEQRPREQHPTPPPPAAPRSAPAPRGATQKRVPGPLDRFLPPSYWEAAASAEAPPPERTVAAPSRQSGPLDAFLNRSQAVAAPLPPAPPARPVPPPFVAAPPPFVAPPPPATSPWPQRDVASPAPSVSPQVVPPPAAPPAPPSAPLLAPRGEPIREAPPPLPPLAAAMPREAPITLSAGAIAAAQTAPTKADKAAAKAEARAAAQAAKAETKAAAEFAKAAKAAAKGGSLAQAPALQIPQVRAKPRVVVPVAPALPPSHVLLRGPIAMGLTESKQELTLEQLGFRINTKIPLDVAWTEVKEIKPRRGRVTIRARNQWIVFGVPVEGVVEPTLAGPLVRVIEEAKTGDLDLSGSAFLDLQRSTDALENHFHDEDDPIIPAIVALVFLLSGAAVAALLPEALVLSTRSAVAPDQFLVDSRLASIDPRILVAAFSLAAMLAAGVVRIAMGQTGGIWARGTLRGWHPDRFGRTGHLARAGLARIVLSPAVAAGLLLAAFLLSLPSAREETIIDQFGIRLNKELPFFDETRGWSEVTDISTVPAPVNQHPEGFAVVFRFENKSTVTTLGHDLRGGTDKQLQRRATEWRDAAH